MDRFPDHTTCPGCGRQNQADARFCSQCASSLVAVPPARKERKFATVLFADLVGSTALTEREDPEVVQAVIGRLFDRLADVIERHGGFLEKYMGDAILAVFGVPVVHEDDPERAIRAALEMHGVLAEMNRGTDQPPLEMRIGVESGDVVVDLERVAGSRDRMLTGDAVNTAARLQNASGIGAVLVGPTAHSLTKDRVDFSEPEVLELKGKSQSVHAFTALRLSAKHAGERPALGFESRMVGRDEELAVLQQTLRRVDSEGCPALVTIFGPAGSGKSRLVRELLRYLDDVDQTFYWRAGRCLPYGAAAYSGLADAIKNQCEVLEDDPADVVAAKVQRTVDDLGGDAEQLTAIEHLLGLRTESEMGREQLFDTWRSFLERMAARYPLVLVLEDIHWADEGLLDFLDFVADWALGGMLIVTLARPELLDHRPTWGGGKNYAAIYIDPLGSEESSEMVTGLLGENLPDDIIRLVTEHAEGNPLYTEEIVRMLIERGLLSGSEEEGWHLSAAIQDIEVPRSIHSLIAARLDGLATDEKSLLQDASVVGRIFWSGIAARLADQDDMRTNEQLGRLRIKELITPREPSSLSDEREYGFHHALIRDVAYDSLSKQLRATKHSIVAQWVETTRAGDRDDVIELIATHYEQAHAYMREIGAPSGEIHDLATKALHWSTQAAERSRRMWQAETSLDWYRKAVAHAESLGLPDEESARLWARYADGASNIIPDPETATLYERALELFGDSKSSDAAVARARYGRVLMWTGDYRRALHIVEGAVTPLRRLSEPAALVQALDILGRLYLWLERRDEARATLTEALGLAQVIGDRRTEGEVSLSLAAVHYQDREWADAFALGGRALEIAREAGDLELLLRASFNQAVSWETYGDPDQIAPPLFREALDLARRHGHRGYQLNLSIGMAGSHKDCGRLDEAVEIFEQAMLEAPPTGPRMQILFLVFWAWIDLYRGDLLAARARLDEADSIDESGAASDTELFQLKCYVYAEIDHLQGDDVAASARLAPLLDDLEELERFAPPDLVLLGVQLSLADDDREMAMRWRSILDHKPTLFAEAFQRWCDAFLSTDPEGAADLFADAADRLRELHLLILEAVCLIDLARVQKELGRDRASTLEPVIAFLRDAGAQRYLAAAEAVLVGEALT